MHRNASDQNGISFSFLMLTLMAWLLLSSLDHPHNRTVLSLYVHEFLLSPLSDFLFYADVGRLIEKFPNFSQFLSVDTETIRLLSIPFTSLTFAKQNRC